MDGRTLPRLPALPDLIIAALFWLGVWIMVTCYSASGVLTWGRYRIYCGMLVLGLILEALTRITESHYTADRRRVRALSPRQ